jgi:hypothetical protein
VPACASLHVETNDLKAVRDALERLLEPGFAAYIALVEPWVSVIAEQLETLDPNDLEQLAVPLSKFGLTVAFIGRDDDLEIWRFPSEQHQRLTRGDLESRAAPLGIPPRHITHFEALEDEGALNEGFERLEREPDKPGLKEFFGRSEDE